MACDCQNRGVSIYLEAFISAVSIDTVRAFGMNAFNTPSSQI